MLNSLVGVLGNVSPVPMPGGGSPPVPDKFTMKNTQAINIAKKGISTIYLHFIRWIFYGPNFMMEEVQKEIISRRESNSTDYFDRSLDWWAPIAFRGAYLMVKKHLYNSKFTNPSIY